MIIGEKLNVRRPAAWMIILSKPTVFIVDICCFANLCSSRLEVCFWSRFECMLPQCIIQRSPQWRLGFLVRFCLQQGQHLRPGYDFNDFPVFSELEDAPESDIRISKASAGTLRLVRLHELFVIKICMENTSLCQSILVGCLWGGTLWKSLF